MSGLSVKKGCVFHAEIARISAETTRNYKIMEELHLGNLFASIAEGADEKEIFDTLFRSDHILIERIISPVSFKADGTWYDQKNDEWVILIKGSAIIEFEEGYKLDLKAGDYLFIPAHLKHRVEETSSQEDTLWLAVHGRWR